MWGHRHLWSEKTLAVFVFEDTGSASDWTATKKKEKGKKKQCCWAILKEKNPIGFAHHRKDINPPTPGRKARDAEAKKINYIGSTDHMGHL